MTIETLTDRLRAEHPGAWCELHPLADGTIRLVVRRPGPRTITSATAETFEQAAAVLDLSPVEPDFPGVPEHLQALVPFLLDKLDGAIRTARWLGWNHDGLTCLAQAGLIELDPAHRDGDELYVRKAGDPTPFPADRTLGAARRR